MNSSWDCDGNASLGGHLVHLLAVLIYCVYNWVWEIDWGLFQIMKLTTFHVLNQNTCPLFMLFLQCIISANMCTIEGRVLNVHEVPGPNISMMIGCPNSDLSDFLSPSMQMPGQHQRLGPDHFFLHSTIRSCLMWCIVSVSNYINK
jgi:hypothetical protein